jgi:hypothetical protein
MYSFYVAHPLITEAVFYSHSLKISKYEKMHDERRTKFLITQIYTFCKQFCKNLGRLSFFEELLHQRGSRPTCAFPPGSKAKVCITVTCQAFLHVVSFFLRSWTPPQSLPHLTAIHTTVALSWCDVKLSKDKVERRSYLSSRCALN